MIELSGLRRYVATAGRARLEADIKFIDMDADAPADTMYFEMDGNYGGMLVNDTYDPFLLPAMYMAMYFHTDIRIRGNVSKRLYKNLTWYGQKILCGYDDNIAPVKIIVDGFTSAERKGTLIGAGISCGVDSLSTLYDRFIREDDPDYRINALFFFNCGSNGQFGNICSENVAQVRCQRSIALAGELGLPLCPVDTNLHQFWRIQYKDDFLFISVYSCVLALQNAIRRYYMASGYSYNEIKSNGTTFEHYDLAGWCESFFLPLIQTESTELIVDGCQYRRVDKIKNFADWDIAQKYLNVCFKSLDNCGSCEKCMRTLLALEILGKLDNFADTFDLERYRKESFNYKVKTVANANRDCFYRELVDLAAENNFPMPVRRDCYAIGRQVVILEE